MAIFNSYVSLPEGTRDTKSHESHPMSTELSANDFDWPRHVFETSVAPLNPLLIMFTIETRTSSK